MCLNSCFIKGKNTLCSFCKNVLYLNSTYNVQSKHRDNKNIVYCCCCYLRIGSVGTPKSNQLPSASTATTLLSKNNNNYCQTTYSIYVSYYWATTATIRRLFIVLLVLTSSSERRQEPFEASYRDTVTYSKFLYYLNDCTLFS